MSEIKNAIDFFAETYRSLCDSPPNDIISHANEVKELFEEKLPIALLALHFDRLNDTKIEFFGKNHKGSDGKIIFNDHEFLVEVTYCKNHKDSLRAECLIKNGVVPGAGPISRNKETKEIVATLEAQDYDSETIDLALRINERIIKKLKNISNYVSGTILIVAFESIKVYSPYNWRFLLERIGKMQKSNFHSIYLCNILTKVIFQIA